MFPSTYYYSLPQEIIANLHYSRRLLLHSPFQHTQPTTQQAPSPTYQVLDPGSSHGNNNNGFDANIIMILAGLICALICSLCINFFIKCVFKCSSLITGRPNYYLNVINYEKKKACGLDKRALKTFPVVKYSNDVTIKGLSNECVICLSEFKGGEKVRILPICNHGFHAKCIDKWLSSNTSCPTCRQSLSETCKKIIGCGDDHHHSSSSSSSLVSPSSTSTPQSTSSREVIIVSIVPHEREDLVRNYRGGVAES